MAFAVELFQDDRDSRRRLGRQFLFEFKNGFVRAADFGIDPPCRERIAVDRPLNSPIDLVEVRRRRRDRNRRTLSLAHEYFQLGQMKISVVLAARPAVRQGTSASTSMRSAVARASGRAAVTV